LRAPSHLTAVPNGGSEVLLSWKDLATVETGYRLEMSFSPFDTPFIGHVEYLPADATSFVFPAFPKSTYYFRVFAVTSVMESDPSDVIAVSTPDVPERPLVTGRLSGVDDADRRQMGRCLERNRLSRGTVGERRRPLGRRIHGGCECESGVGPGLAGRF
jgi:hypothetical protein